MERKTRYAIFAVAFTIFGLAYLIVVFSLTPEWSKRAHAVLIAAINIGAALYLRFGPDGKKKSSPNKEPHATG